MYRPPLSSLAPYMYEAWYDTIDYAYAYQWFRSHTPVVGGGCSTVRKGNLIGRNLDWTYSESAEFVVHTDGVVGVANAIPGLTDAFVKSGADDEIYKIVPFMLSDGMNKHGLMVSTLVVPTDKGDNSVVRPSAVSGVELCTLMLPRYVLDTFWSAETACSWLQRFATLYHPKTLQDQHYDQHFVIADKIDTYCMEFIGGQYVVHDISDKPYVTNFHLSGVTFNDDGSVYTPATGGGSLNSITPNGSGLERYNLINSHTGSVESLMRELAYTRAYQSSPNPAVPRWDTEFVGNGRTVDTPTADYDIIQMAAATEYQRRTRSSGTTWQTVHSAVYDVQEKKLRLYAQENFDTHWEVSVMADQTHVQHLRGNTARNDAFTGSAGELTVDMEVKTVRMHDGVKAGGYPLVSTAATNQTIDGAKTFSEYAYGVTAPDEDSSKKLATTEFVHRVAQGGTSVISIPVVTGDTSVISGGTSSYNFSAVSALVGGQILSFKVSASGAMTLAPVTVPAVSDAGSYTLSVPSGLAPNDKIIFSVVARDNFGNESKANDYELTILEAYVDAPTITAPQYGMDVYPLMGVPVSTSAFKSTGYADTHKDTDWVISRDAQRQNVVAQDLADASDKVSHMFTAQDLTMMAPDASYYISVRHRGTVLGESEWASVVVNAKPGYLFADRYIYRHESLPGSVIEYDEFGTAKKLFVADAAYRGKAQWRTVNTDVSAVSTWNHYYSIGATTIDTQTGYVDMSTFADITPYESKMTDSYFNAALIASLAPVLQTAKVATDYMVSTGNCPAATFCRSKSVGVELQLPNAYQLLVMYASGDIIDMLDPTLAANPTYALGYRDGNRWYSGGTTYTWASMERDSTRAFMVHSGGGTGRDLRTTSLCVTPVAEL